MGKPRPVKFVWAEEILGSEFTTHGRVRALLCVGTYMDPPGDSCFPSERRVADDFPVSRDTVHGALVDAAAAGWLLWRPRTFSDGTQLPSQRGRSEFEYQATFPDGHPAWGRIDPAAAEQLRRRAVEWSAEIDAWRRGDPVVGDPDHQPPEAAETSVVRDPDHQPPEAAETSVVRDPATPAGGMKQRPPVVGTGGGGGTRTIPPDSQEPAEPQDGQAVPLAIDHDHMDQATSHDGNDARARARTSEDGPSGPRPDDDGFFRCGCSAVVGGPDILCADCRNGCTP